MNGTVAHSVTHAELSRWKNLPRSYWLNALGVGATEEVMDAMANTYTANLANSVREGGHNVQVPDVRGTDVVIEESRSVAQWSYVVHCMTSGLAEVASWQVRHDSEN